MRFATEASILRAQVERLRVHSESTEQHIVHLANGAAHRVLEDLAFLKLLEIQPRHWVDSFLGPRRHHLRRDGKSSATRESRSTGVREELSMRAVPWGI